MVLIKLLAFVVGALVIAIVVPRKKDHKYNTLDKVGIATNIVLLLAYIPLSYLGIMMVFFSDGADRLSGIKMGVLCAGIALGISTFFVSVISIVLSIVARKRGKRIFSFIIQFAPIVLFAIAFFLSIIALL